MYLLLVHDGVDFCRTHLGNVQQSSTMHHNMLSIVMLALLAIVVCGQRCVHDCIACPDGYRCEPQPGLCYFMGYPEWTIMCIPEQSRLTRAGYLRHSNVRQQRQ